MAELSPFPYKTTVLVAAASKDLTVKATVKTELGISGSTDDDQIDTWIHQASAAIFSYLGYEVAAETVSEKFLVPDDCDTLWLSRTPVTAISGVVSGNTLGITEDEDTLVLDTDYEVNYQTGEVYRLDTDSERGELWEAGVHITVKYTGGWVALTTVPHDLERACIDLVKSYYYARERDPALRSEAVPDVYSVSYRDADKMADAASGGMPPQIAGLLDQYRRLRVG